MFEIVKKIHDIFGFFVSFVPLCETNFSHKGTKDTKDVFQ